MSVSDFRRARRWIEEVAGDREVIWPLVREWVIGVDFVYPSDAVAFRSGSSWPWIMLDDRSLALGETEWGSFEPDPAMEDARDLIEQINAGSRCKVGLGFEVTFGFRDEAESALFDENFRVHQ